jgi:hypothetical protein
MNPEKITAHYLITQVNCKQIFINNHIKFEDYSHVAIAFGKDPFIGRGKFQRR